MTALLRLWSAQQVRLAMPIPWTTLPKSAHRSRTLLELVLGLTFDAGARNGWTINSP